MPTREQQLRRAVAAFIVTGLLFMLLPGTFLGVWNLISISGRHQLDTLSPAWIQAHGHAQIFGWLGAFILGIGFFSLSRMGELPRFAVSRAWTAYALWTAGAALRWFANVTLWEWRIALPVSALLELAGFATFFATVSRHKPAAGARLNASPKPREAWMLVVVSGTVGFLATLLANVYTAFQASIGGISPAIPASLDHRLLTLPVWTFLAPTVWGFSARWLPVFLGLKAPNGQGLICACAIAWIGAISCIAGASVPGAIFIFWAAWAAVASLQIFAAPEKPAKTAGVHPAFPVFVKAAYAWLLAAGALTVWAAAADRAGGIGGASRHAVTVGFFAAMVFAIGQRILPAFLGGRALFSARAMFAASVLLNIGCFLRVLSEIPAYENFAYAGFFWRVLPISAVIELAAVSIFAANLVASIIRKPVHVPESHPIWSAAS